jgi:hypothetical protein
MARLINDTHLFIHSAKTGGTFFREMLNRFGVKNYEVGDKHDSITDIHTKFNNEFCDRTSFGFVRNPLTWYRSRWSYGMMTYFGEKLQAFPINHPIHQHWMADVWSHDFNVFLERCLRIMDATTVYRDGIAFDYFNKMLGLENQQILTLYDRVDRVYRYENIVYVMASIFRDEFNMSVSLRDLSSIPKILESKVIDVKPSPELLKELEKAEKRLLGMYY